MHLQPRTPSAACCLLPRIGSGAASRPPAVHAHACACPCPARSTVSGSGAPSSSPDAGSSSASASSSSSSIGAIVGGVVGGIGESTRGCVPCQPPASGHSAQRQLTHMPAPLRPPPSAALRALQPRLRWRCWPPCGGAGARRWRGTAQTLSRASAAARAGLWAAATPRSRAAATRPSWTLSWCRAPARATRLAGAVQEERRACCRQAWCFPPPFACPRQPSHCSVLARPPSSLVSQQPLSGQRPPRVPHQLPPGVPARRQQPARPPRLRRQPDPGDPHRPAAAAGRGGRRGRAVAGAGQ